MSSHTGTLVTTEAEIPLLAVDAGFGKFGVAAFDVARYLDSRQTLEDALRAQVGVWQYKTDSGQDDAERLRQINDTMAHLVMRIRPYAAYVERPAIAGLYGRNSKGAQKGVNKLYMGIGAMLSGLARAVEQLEHPCVLAMHRASKLKKEEERHQLLELTAKSIGVELPRGERGGKQSDAWDASWLGCEVLTGRALSDLPAELAR